MGIANRAGGLSAEERRFYYHHRNLGFGKVQFVMKLL